MGRRFTFATCSALVAVGLLSGNALARAQAPTDPSPHHVSQIAVSPGVRLEVLDWGGTGEPMVFLPGNGYTAHSYDDFALRFRDRYHVYGITPRGFGNSSRPDSGYDSATRARDILAVLDTLGIRRAILVGHSIAGDELSRLGADFPDRVRALVYLDAYSFGSDGPPTNVKPPPAKVPPMTAADSASVLGVAAWVERVYGLHAPVGELLTDAVYSPTTGRLVGHVPPNAAPGKVARGTVRSNYARIQAPVLAICAIPTGARQYFVGYDQFSKDERAAADSFFAAHEAWRARQIQRFRTEVKHGVVVEIAGADHFVFWSHPDRVEQAMRDFLARTLQ